MTLSADALRRLIRDGEDAARRMGVRGMTISGVERRRIAGLLADLCGVARRAFDPDMAGYIDVADDRDDTAQQDVFESGAA